MLSKCLLALTLAMSIGACHHHEPAAPTKTDPGQTGSGSASTGSGSGGVATGTGPGISEKCGDADACAAGLTCVSYYGIAGARGPQFKSCELRCVGKTEECPEGRHCATVADGPGRVCR